MRGGNEGSQKLCQHRRRIYHIPFPFVPILCFWNLRIQHGAVLSNELALFASYLFTDCRCPCCLGIVQNIKFYRVSVPLDLRQQAVLLFCARLDPNIMGGDTLQHIFAFADVQDLTFDLDAVDAWMFILGRKPPPAQHCVCIIYIILCHLKVHFQN